MEQTKKPCAPERGHTEEVLKKFFDRMQVIERHYLPKTQEPIYETRIRASAANQHRRKIQEPKGSVQKWFARMLAADFSDKPTFEITYR